MAMTGITIDAGEVMSIASSIENDNNKLRELLDQSKTTLDNLSANWTGKAADETRAAYTSFSSKFFQQYQDILNQYVTFLRRNVADDYTQTENLNTQLADSFK